MATCRKKDTCTKEIYSFVANFLHSTLYTFFDDFTCARRYSSCKHTLSRDLYKGITS